VKIKEIRALGLHGEKLHQHTFWQGRGGAITHTISGIDIALWDILGKVTAQPIGRLPGGRYKERIKPYASLLMDGMLPIPDAPGLGIRLDPDALERYSGRRLTA
jgi:L-alanine-DL-glutamate epimerase-like enolase superfamily enzyme